ncbi:MAG: hypothetical protein J5I90_08365 [Caldilineales bacterium]|nr:hypothetical protein [Caldilineales bacterium]
MRSSRCYSRFFFGFGWKGLSVAGKVVPPGEYACYCRYLVGGDGSGYETQMPAGGKEIERWAITGSRHAFNQDEDSSKS